MFKFLRKLFEKVFFVPACRQAGKNFLGWGWRGENS